MEALINYNSRINLNRHICSKQYSKIACRPSRYNMSDHRPGGHGRIPRLPLLALRKRPTTEKNAPNVAYPLKQKAKRRLDQKWGSTVLHPLTDC